MQSLPYELQDMILEQCLEPPDDALETPLEIFGAEPARIDSRLIDLWLSARPLLNDRWLYHLRCQFGRAGFLGESAFYGLTQTLDLLPRAYVEQLLYVAEAREFVLSIPTEGPVYDVLMKCFRTQTYPASADDNTFNLRRRFSLLILSHDRALSHRTRFLALNLVRQFNLWTAMQEARASLETGDLERLLLTLFVSACPGHLPKAFTAGPEDQPMACLRAMQMYYPEYTDLVWSEVESRLCQLAVSADTFTIMSRLLDVVIGTSERLRIRERGPIRSGSYEGPEVPWSSKPVSYPVPPLVMTLMLFTACKRLNVPDVRIHVHNSRYSQEARVVEAQLSIVVGPWFVNFYVENDVELARMNLWWSRAFAYTEPQRSFSMLVNGELRRVMKSAGGLFIDRGVGSLAVRLPVGMEYTVVICYLATLLPVPMGKLYTRGRFSGLTMLLDESQGLYGTRVITDTTVTLYERLQPRYSPEFAAGIFLTQNEASEAAVYLGTRALARLGYYLPLAYRLFRDTALARHGSAFIRDIVACNWRYFRENLWPESRMRAFRDRKKQYPYLRTPVYPPGQLVIYKNEPMPMVVLSNHGPLHPFVDEYGLQDDKLDGMCIVLKFDRHRVHLSRAAHEWLREATKQEGRRLTEVMRTAMGHFVERFQSDNRAILRPCVRQFC